MRERMEIDFDSTPDFIGGVEDTSFRSHEFRDLRAVFRSRTTDHCETVTEHDYDWLAQNMLQLIAHRQTSRRDDEAICISSYLGL